MSEHYLKHKRDESDRAGYTVVEDSNRLPIFSYLSRRANNIIVRIRGTFNFVRGTVGGMFQFKKRTDTTTYATGENIGLININGDLYVRTNTADIFRIGNSGNIYVTRTIIMEGSTINDFSTSLVVTDPTANRIITFPDATGTVALTSDIPASTTYTAGTGLDLGGTEFTVDVSDFMTNGSDNRIVTATGTDAMNAEANLTWDGDDFYVTSSGSGRPQLHLTNTNTNSKAPGITFTNDKGVAGAINDEAGSLLFKSDNANQTLVNFGKLTVNSVGVTAGDEAGSLSIVVATSNGTSSVLRDAFVATGNVSDATISTSIGFGTSSTATIAGSLRVEGAGVVSTGDLTVTPGGTLELDSTGDMTLDSSANIELNADGGSITFKDDTATLATIDTNGISFVDNTGAGVRFEGSTDDAHNTVLLATDPTGARICMLPDTSGTLAVLADINKLVHIQIKDFGSYLFYLFHDDNWYSAGSTTLAILGSSTSPSDLSSSNSKYQGRMASYTAPAACTLKKLCFSFYWSSSAVNSADIDFAFSKFTPISDGTSATITMNSITATDNDGSYTENAPYYLTFEFSGGNASLSAGDSFAFHMRTTGGSSSQRILIYGQATLSVELS